MSCVVDSAMSGQNDQYFDPRAVCSVARAWQHPRPCSHSTTAQAAEVFHALRPQWIELIDADHCTHEFARALVMCWTKEAGGRGQGAGGF
jgi:hypothetical protein